MTKLRYGVLVACAFCLVVAFAPAARACPTACCLPDGGCADVNSQEECGNLGGFTASASEEVSYCASVICGEMPIECRMTGGGNDTNTWDGSFASGADNVDRYTFGGQVGAPTADLPQPYGEWTHHQMRGPDGDFVFHAGTASAPAATKIELVTCSDPGFCQPARPAPAKQIDYIGVGAFKNMKGVPAIISSVAKVGTTFHAFEVHVEDAGEPGRGGKIDPPAQFCPVHGSGGALVNCDCPDFYVISIHANVSHASPVIYRVGGYITGGNLRIHPPL